MKKIIILLSTLFLLAGCIESVAVLGGGATNGRIVQSSFQSGVSLGIKKETGKTPLRHALDYVKKKKISKEQGSCSLFDNKEDLEICLMVKEKLIVNQSVTKNRKIFEKPSNDIILSLQSSINEKSKIKYLD